MQSMVDDAKIEAAIARLDGTPGYGRVAVTDLGFAMRETGLTVAELRKILEAARGQAWRDASERPGDDRLVWVQRLDGSECRARQLASGLWLSPHFGVITVHRWRELPR